MKTVKILGDDGKEYTESELLVYCTRGKFSEYSEDKFDKARYGRINETDRGDYFVTMDACRECFQEHKDEWEADQEFKRGVDIGGRKFRCKHSAEFRRIYFPHEIRFVEITTDLAISEEAEEKYKDDIKKREEDRKRSVEDTAKIITEEGAVEEVREILEKVKKIKD